MVSGGSGIHRAEGVDRGAHLDEYRTTGSINEPSGTETGWESMQALPLGVHVGERLSLEQTYWQAQVADEHGFDCVWVAEGRLSPVTASCRRRSSPADHERVRIGTGVVNNKTPQRGLMAVTFKTLDEVAPGRVVLGIGAWWEPLARCSGPRRRR